MGRAGPPQRRRAVRGAQQHVVPALLATGARPVEVRWRCRRARLGRRAAARRQRVLPPPHDVNRWVARHADALTDDLADDEELVAAHRVEVRGSVPDPVEGERVMTRGSSRKRFMLATELGFALPGPVFVLGMSNRRVLFYRASPFLAAPQELESSLPLEDVATITFVRRLGRGHLAVLLEKGPLLVVRSLWGRGLHDLARAFADAR